MKASKCLFAVFDMSAQRAVRGLRSLAGRLRTSSDSRYLSQRAAIGPYIRWPSVALSAARCTTLVRAIEREGNGFVVVGGGAVSLPAGGGGGIPGPGASVDRLGRPKRPEEVVC
jgi:hypothetical protein